jgi:hypothetical protein
MATQEPAWWRPLPLTHAHLSAHPCAGPHYVGEEQCEQWLWRYVRALPAPHLAWLCSDAVVVTRSIEYLSGTVLNGYWGHHWVWARRVDGAVVATLKLTSFFRQNHSRFWMNDGTEKLLTLSDVAGTADMLRVAIERHMTSPNYTIQ